jgi:tRNA-dihydrouridine synthase
MIRRHIRMNVAQKGERIGVISFRCQVAAYCKGIENGGALRDAMMRQKSLAEVEETLDAFANQYAAGPSGRLELAGAPGA